MKTRFANTLPAFACSAVLALSLVACGSKQAETKTNSGETKTTSAQVTSTSSSGSTESADEVNFKQKANVMDYNAYTKAAVDSSVNVSGYVTAVQAYKDGAVNFYLQDDQGAYFVYGAKCSEDDAKKLTEGTAVEVNGYKAEFNGEVEIADAKFKIVNVNPVFYTASDVSSDLSTEGLKLSMNRKVAFKDMVIVASTDPSSKEVGFLYNYDGSGAPGQNNDLYFKASKEGGEGTITFTVESSLTDENSEVYKKVTELKPGDKVDLEGLMYWYEGPNPQITKVTVK